MKIIPSFNDPQKSVLLDDYDNFVEEIYACTFQAFLFEIYIEHLCVAKVLKPTIIKTINDVLVRFQSNNIVLLDPDNLPFEIDLQQQVIHNKHYTYDFVRLSDLIANNRPYLGTIDVKKS